MCSELEDGEEIARITNIPGGEVFEVEVATKGVWIDSFPVSAQTSTSDAAKSNSNVRFLHTQLLARCWQSKTSEENIDGVTRV